MIISRRHFKQATGEYPVQDDLERANCPKAGTFGHTCCGWNHEDNMPNFMVPSKAALAAIRGEQ